MIRPNTLYLTDRAQWRAWLKEHFDKEKEVWLIFPNKSSGQIRLPYNDAVEEALCFGWIDSIVKSLDKDRAIQRFTPRNPKSGYSQLNRERLAWLLEQSLIHPSIIKKTEQILSKEYIFPQDILEAIRKDPVAWENFRKFSESYKRIRIAYINGARQRPQEFRKRLDFFITRTRKNKLIKAYGGAEKYY
jgi:uncharacterized protein YdeI (YjbR/CyaY-like superfamily)